MAAGTRNVIGATVFTPATPVAVAYMRNMVGSATTLPTRIAAGNFAVIIPMNLDFQRISITARAYNAAGTSRIVSVVPTVVGLTTRFDIFIRDDAAALTDDALNVEVTVSRLPL